jgi:hypothetical protein
VVLDATIFHPQGGGQPADTGVISAAAWRFLVEDVRVKDGVVSNGISHDLGLVREIGHILLRMICTVFMPVGFPLRAIRGCCWRRVQTRARQRAERYLRNRRRSAQSELKVRSWSTHGVNPFVIFFFVLAIRHRQKLREWPRTKSAPFHSVFVLLCKFSEF